MAFPAVASRSTGRETVDTTSHPVILPTGSGGLLLVAMGADGDVTCTDNSGTWTKLGQAAYTTIAAIVGAVFYKTSTGSDALTVTTSLVSQTSYVAFRITDGSLVTGTGVGGAGPDSNPPSHTAPSAEDRLWIVFRAGDNVETATAAPANYTNLTSIAATSSAGASTSTAERLINTNVQDPGAFTSANRTWVCWTISITGGATHAGAATLAAASSLAAGARLPGAAVTLPAGSSLTAVPTRQINATLAAASSLASGAGLPGASVALAAQASLASSMAYLAHAAAALPAASALSGSAVPPTTMAAMSNLVTSGLLLPGRAASTLAAQSSLQIVGFGFIPVGATLAAQATLSGTLYTVWPGATAMTAGSRLVAGTTLPLAGAALAAVSRLATTGPYLVTSGSDLVLLQVETSLVATAIAFRPALVAPAGPVRRLLRTPQYRLYAADTRSGRVGWELPFSELSWNTPLNEVGTLRASLVIEDSLDRLSDQGARDPRTVFREVLTGPYRFSLVLAWGDQVVFAGPYLPSTNPGDRPTVDVGAGELMRLMDKRVLCDPAETFTLGPTSSGGIIKGLIDRATANKASNIWWRQGRELPITCAHPPSTSGSLTRSYFGYDTVKAADALASHAAEEDAPDYRLDPYFVTGADGLYVRWELRIGDPTLSAAYDPWIFDDSNAIVSQDIDAGRMASMWFVPGSGQDEKKLMSWWVNMSVVSQGFPALEEVESSHSSETSKSVLDNIAKSTLARYVRPVDQWTVRVPADSLPELGSYRVGDAMAVDIRRHPVIEPGVYTRRITEITGDATPWVSLTSSVKA